MANNDRTKWEYFFKLNVIELLNTTSFYKDKGDYELELEKRARNGK